MTGAKIRIFFVVGNNDSHLTPYSLATNIMTNNDNNGNLISESLAPNSCWNEKQMLGTPLHC
jgi:hypothetical protein